MSEVKLGELAPRNALRDAVHVAVLPVVAQNDMAPGHRVRVVSGGGAKKCGKSETSDGIVDPFLHATVRKGERFWMFLYPGTVTGMRHHWECPSIEDQDHPEVSAEYSKAWLMEFCNTHDTPGYELVMHAIVNGTEDLNYRGNVGFEVDENSIYFMGADASGEIPPEFWFHAENVLGGKISVKPKMFTCGC